MISLIIILMTLIYLGFMTMAAVFNIKDFRVIFRLRAQNRHLEDDLKDARDSAARFQQRLDYQCKRTREWADRARDWRKISISEAWDTIQAKIECSHLRERIAQLEPLAEQTLKRRESDKIRKREKRAAETALHSTDWQREMEKRLQERP